MTTRNEDRERLMELLPWHATGRLSREEAARVERELESDAALRRQYDFVLEELAGTVDANEAVGQPSPELGDRLMARIDHYEQARQPAVAKSRRLDLAGWLAGVADTLVPRQVGWAAAALAFAVLLQAGIIAALLVSDQRAPAYVTASDQVPDTDGVRLIVAFNRNAAIGEMTDVLDRFGGRIVEGPLPGGLFRVAFAPDSRLDEADLIAALQSEPAVGSVLPGR